MGFNPKQLREKKERLIDAIANGVAMKSVFQRVADMDADIERLSDMPSLPALDISEAEIKEILGEALAAAAHHIENTKFAAPIRRILDKVVERIDLTPVEGQRNGEYLSFVFRENGWALLYCHIHEAWPGVRSRKKAA